jgi:DNA replication protein DnaC
MPDLTDISSLFATTPAALERAVASITPEQHAAADAWQAERIEEINRAAREVHIERLIRDAGIGGDWLRAIDARPWEPDPATAEARRAVDDYIASVRERVDSGDGLLLASKIPGTGKTRMAVEILIAAARKADCKIYLAYNDRVATLFNSESFDQYDEQGDVMRKIAEYPLVCLDDLGSTADGGRHLYTVRGLARLMECVNDRSNSNLSTIVTTNLTTSDEIRAIYGDRFTSRILGLVGKNVYKISTAADRRVSKT